MATTNSGRRCAAGATGSRPRPPGCPPAGTGAAGLRREELALLAGISVDYVTRLEQGRAANPPAQVVEALTRALQLSGTERAHLFRRPD